MAECFIGEIRMFAGNYAPSGWAFCNGQELQISQHTPLYAIIGTTYGGDGMYKFRLPDLQGRVPVAVGLAAGQPASNRRHAGKVFDLQSSKTEHTHSVHLPNGITINDTPTDDVVLKTTPNTEKVGDAPAYFPLHFIIALEGIFPARD